MSQKQRILVTGAAGFIGGHVCEVLQTEHEVLALDDLSSGKRENVPEGVDFVQTDIRDSAALNEVFREFRPDIVSHHAAQTSVSISVREPLEDASINVIGGLNVLRAALASGVSRFVFASTGGAMYGETGDEETAQVGRPPLPRSPYACSKLAFEGYLRGLASDEMAWSILRYANVYGPRQDPHGEAGVVAIFAKLLLANKPLALFGRRVPGDGGCIRDYIHVEDVARIHACACAGELDNRISHVATGVPTSTLEIARQLSRILQYDPVINDGPPRPGDLERSVLTPGEGKYAAMIGVSEGLQSTADWFRASHG